MRLNARPGGFSLIELLAIIVVVSLMASLAMQSMTVLVQDVRRARTEREMDMLAHGIVGNPAMTQAGVRSDFGYVGDVGAFPPDLAALRRNPGGWSTWRGPYLEMGYNEDSVGYTLDDWGAPYVYTGGLEIVSIGGGTSITKRLADATSDCLLNAVEGTVADAASNAPGVIFDDSVSIVVTAPNGAGGLASKTYHPNPAGRFRLDSLPVGERPLLVVFMPQADTLHRVITVLPRHKTPVAVRFAGDYFAP